MVKARQWHMTVGSPAVGGYPAVTPEPVRVVGWETMADGSRWCRVRLTTGGRLMMHPDRLQPQPVAAP